MTAIAQRWRWLLSGLLASPRYVLILRLTAILIVLHDIDVFHWTRLPERLLALAMLVSPRLLTYKPSWLVMSGLLVANNLWHWSVLVNHEYLVTYWVLACTLAVYAAAPLAVLAWNARLLIGLCFGFATLWKFLAGEYLDGSFMHLTLLLDPRLSMGATLLGGVEQDLLEHNRALFTTAQTYGFTEPLLLRSTPLMSVVSVLLSYWTILIEGVVALSFLLPRPKWLYRQRDWLLLIFVFTTYAVIPVLGFGALLLIMGLAQTRPQHDRLCRVYLSAALLVPVWMLLPQGVFHLVRLLA